MPRRNDYLVLVGSKYSFRLTLPAPLRALLVRTAFKRALGTGDYETARRKAARLRVQAKTLRGRQGLACQSLVQSQPWARPQGTAGSGFAANARRRRWIAHRAPCHPTECAQARVTHRW
ncbi:MAG: DUF6538 domain-containing protein [Caulobacter sp.]